MFVIRAKRIYLILACVLISTTFFQLATQKKETVETVALPIHNKVIVLDAGHRRRRWTVRQVVTEYQKQI